MKLRFNHSINNELIKFQLLLKGCTIEACADEGDKRYIAKFQLLLKGCTIEALQILS